MLMVVAEARVQYASLKTNFTPLLKTTRLSPRVQQPKQSILPEMAHALEVTPGKIIVFRLVERISRRWWWKRVESTPLYS
ncbi:hypothetical protein Hanom_Chr08g00723621 [Helianthus anomalus]